MIAPVILSGGSGTRLWPLSRSLYPKQFISLINKTTLFQDTVLRLPENALPPLVICNEEHRFIVAEQLRQIPSDNNGIILEPIGKNTAPAIAIAAMNLLNNNEDPVLLVLSADHLIHDNKKFHNAIGVAKKLAEEGLMLTLGTKPTKPETGYGYIEVANSLKKEFYNIISFTEKPTLEVAQNYLKMDSHYWNSGIFMFKASVYLQELEKFEPEIFSACQKSCSHLNIDLDFIRLNNEEFYKCPNKSIDYAVMEKTKKGVMVPLNGGWSDIGSWKSLWEAKIKDKKNNFCEGDVILNKVENSFIHSSNRLVSVNDLSDVVIIDTQDALLVSSKKNSNNIKGIVKIIKDSKRKESESHRKVYRPWGYYDLIEHGDGFQVKRIFVSPGAKLSLQKHQKRSEHWVIVKGIALVTSGENIFKLKANESTYIPKNVIHRLENCENIPLEIIEIQTGSYFGEDDIIRLEDDYKRS